MGVRIHDRGTEHRAEHGRDEVFGQDLGVAGARSDRREHGVERRAGHQLGDQHVFDCEDRFGDVQSRPGCHRLGHGSGVAGLHAQVQFGQEGLPEPSHHLDSPRDEAGRERGGAQVVEIGPQRVGHPRVEDLHGDGPPIGEVTAMHLSEGRGGEGKVVDIGEQAGGQPGHRGGYFLPGPWLGLPEQPTQAPPQLRRHAVGDERERLPELVCAAFESPQGGDPGAGREC